MIVTGREIGLKRLGQLAGAAESSGDWWLAARLWSIAREVTYQQSGNKIASDPDAAMHLGAKSLYAVSQMPDASDPEARDDISFQQARTIVTAYDVPTILARMAEFSEILKTSAAAREPAAAAAMGFLMGSNIPLGKEWTFEEIGEFTLCR